MRSNSDILTIISVDDTDLVTFKAGAKESCTTGGADFEIRESCYLVGMTIIAEDEFIAVRSQTSYTKMTLCTFGSMTNSRGIRMRGVGYLEMEDCVWQPQTATSQLISEAEGRVTIRNMTLDTSVVQPTGTVFNMSNTSSMEFDIDGIDLSNGHSDLDLFNKITDPSYPSPGWKALRNVKLPSGGIITTDTLRNQGTSILTGCHATDDDSQLIYERGGTITKDDSIYIGADDDTPEGVGFSYKIVTLSYVSKTLAVPWNFPSEWFDPSLAASNVVTIYLTCAATLHTDDIQVSVSANLAASKSLSEFFTSNYPKLTNSWALNPLASADSTTELADGTAAVWTGGLTNEYKIEVDLSTGSTLMSNCAQAPRVVVKVTKPSATIYFSPQLGLS